MRVALIVERFEATGGGLEQAAWQTAHALARAGDSVTVVARRAQPSNAIESVTLPVPSFWQPLRIHRFASRARAWIEAARSEGRVDVIHAWSRVPGADVFHSGEGSHAHYMRRSYGRSGARWRRVSPRHAAQLELERQIFAAPGLWLQSVSGMVERELAERFRLPAERVARIAYGVDTERFAPRGEGENAGAKWRLELDPAAAGNAPLFLLVGSGWRRKGLATAMRALAQMAARDARLWVAGRDDTRPWRRLAAQLGVAGRVNFLGSRPDMERVYAACDALLLPTRYDAFGMVCLEAASAGLPVVMSGSAGAAELLADAGIVVDDPDDAAGFARALDALCDPGTRKPLAERGRAIACEHTWQHQTEALRAVYRRVIAGAT